MESTPRTTAFGPSVPMDLKLILQEGKETGHTPAELAETAIARMKNLYVHYHRIQLNDNLYLPGRMTTEQERVLTGIRRYLKPGQHVVDIGCRDGLFSVEAFKRGAGRIVSVDNDPADVFQDIVIPWFEMDVELRMENYLFMEPPLVEAFDLAVFSGVLYHLRYPMYGLAQVYRMLRPNGIMILETAFIDAFNDFPIMCCPIGRESPYEPTSVTFFNRYGLRDTLASLGFDVVTSLDEFTYDRAMQTDYDRLPFPAGTSQTNIGRLIWVCQKSDPPIEKWANAFPSVDVTRGYWNAGHYLHHQKPAASGGSGQ